MKIGTIGATQYLLAAISRHPSAVAPPAERLAGADTVQISDLSRAKLAQMADSSLAAERAEEASARAGREQKLTDVRQRITEGYYSNPDVLRKIAERITDNNEENL
jgi:Anti-sigma-28 factor, FlgM